MGQSDKWFRWSINIFVFLMCFQLGMLLFLKSLFYKAEQKLNDNKAEVSFACGDFNQEGSYWKIPGRGVFVPDYCEGEQCPDSHWVFPQAQERELHVLAVNKARPSQVKNGQRENGYFVNVEVKKSDKETILALVSRSMMQWNLQVTKEMKNLKEVLIIGSDLVWVEGLPEGVKLTYFSPEQICAFPTAWQEIKNPANEFRRLYRALKNYTGLEVSSFQGKEVARELKVPFKVSQRALSETKKIQRKPSSQGSIAHHLATGLHWQRNNKTLLASRFHFHKQGQLKKVDIPQKSMDAFYEAATDQIYLINNHQFGVWDVKNKQFSPLHLPLEMPAMYWPTAMTFNPLRSEIYIYNDDRGGEIVAFNVVTKKWRSFAQKVGYSFVALYFDTSQNALYGTHFKNKKIGSLIKMNSKGEKLKSIALVKPLDFAKNRWKAQILSSHNEFWLKVTHPAHPGGDIYPLQGIKQAL